MKSIKLYISIFAFSILAFSCEEEDNLIEDRLESNPDITVEPETGDSGSLDVSTYVSIGASITAGTMDGALYTHSQNNSFPVLLAQQFAIEGVGGGEFNVPDIASLNGYASANSDGSINGKLILDLDLNNDGALGDAGIISSVGEVPAAFAGDKSTLNNFGVPGIQTAQILTPLTGGPDSEANPAYNALYARFASDPGVSTILTEAIARNPTFVSLWLGGNDVLGYAVSGGTNESLLTDPASVEFAINTIVTSILGSTSATGVMVNVPNVVALPHFQAVPYDAIPMEDEATATATNAAFTDYNGALQAAVGASIITSEEAATRTISFEVGANGIVIEDPTLTDVATLSGGQIPIPQYRQLAEGELVLLAASNLLGTLADENDPTSVYGVGVPLPDAYSLRADELAKIVTQLTAINTSIATVAATQDRLVMFDAYTLLLGIAVGGGYTSDETGGVTLLPDFSPNGIFSNDGIHPNARGHAIVTNEIIDLLAEEFGSDIPKLNVLDYNSSPFQQ